MKRIIVLTVLCLLQVSEFAGAQGIEDKRAWNEFSVRAGLPNFFSKALQSGSVKVAYLGGSITKQEGWRVHSLNWFKERFPQASFSEVNAAVNGTGSDFGAFRLKEQVLKHKPDLVFVEFAVNDGKTESAKIIRSMEGIVRQIKQANPYTDICFVYTISKYSLEEEQKGMLPNSAQQMEKVADHYGIPSINFGFEIASMVSNQQLILEASAKEQKGLKVFSPDGTHPYPETGHVIYQNVLKRSFEKMIPTNASSLVKSKLPKPMVSDCYVNTQMVDIKDVKLSSNWELINSKENPSFSEFSNFLPFIGKAGQSGETITIHFKGRSFGFFDIMGPDAGRVIVEIDGAVKDTIRRFDPYCSYRRMNYGIIGGLEDKKHTVVLRSLCEPFDKTAILSNKESITKNPEVYKPNNLYIGKILIEGKILK
ncbi:SGNH/GDSL hydrolase family protein [Pedobacter borealis]|uniref:SGNH/GDSL hydrolase family protein n=1 Tax=Pedobacter borealis TaxID=475254 RepID=UPI000560E621|nr:SGNH/GDSL hydrolase family protein [Pedobacter borealis]